MLFIGLRYVGRRRAKTVCPEGPLSGQPGIRKGSHLNILRGCARLLAAASTLAFAASALFALLFFNLQLQFTRPAFFKRVLVENQVYEALPHLLSTQLSDSVNYDPCAEDPSICESKGEAELDEEPQGGPPEYFTTMDWGLVFEHVLTKEWLQTQVEDVIDQFFVFFESNEQDLGLTISLVDLKTSLTGQKGVALVREIIESLPACGEAQLDEFEIMLGSSSDEVDMISCRPPDEILENYYPLMTAKLDQVVTDLPDDAKLGGGPSDSRTAQTHDADHPQVEPIVIARRVVSYLRLSPLLPIVFLTLIAVFAVRSLKDLLRWWGIPLAATGLGALVLSLLSTPLFDWLLATFVEGRIPGYFSAEVVDLGFDIARYSLGTLRTSLAIQSGVVALVGITMWVGSAFIQSRRIESLTNLSSGS
jgi:hypothetical protein